MPKDHATTGPEVVHPRLSVAWVSASDRADVARLLGRGRSHHTGQRGRCGSDSGRRARPERAAALARLERDLAAALAARDAAVAERDRVERRLTRLNEGVAWSDKTLARLPELGAAVRRASTEAGLREAEHSSARAKLEHVVEQRAEAAAATDAATRELQGLDGSQLDETSLRREVESANRIAQESAAARADAEARTAELEARAITLAGELDRNADERARAEADRGLRPADVAPVRSALSALRAASDNAALDARAQSLATLITELDRTLAISMASLPPGPDPAAVEAAVQELARARAVLVQAQEACAEATLTPDQRSELNVAHEAVVAAEQRAASGLGRAVGRRRLEQARRHEADVLARHGFASHLDLVVSGGRRPDLLATRAAAEHRVHDAAANLTALRAAAAAPPEMEQLQARRERLLAEAARLLRVDPGEHVIALLERARSAPDDLAGNLARALASVGMQPVGVSLDEAATRWLADQDEILARHSRASARIAQLDEERRQLAAELGEVERGLAQGADEIRRIAETEAGARREVAGLEGELTARASEDVRRHQRMVAAGQLRVRVDALQGALHGAEVEARAAVGAAAELVAAAAMALERAEAEVAEVGREALRWNESLPAERGVDLTADPLRVIESLGEALRLETDDQHAAVGRAHTALEATTATVEATDRLVAEARADADGSPTARDLADAVRKLVADADTGQLAVLDHPVSSDLERDALLDATRARSNSGPVVLLTDDPEVLGWAITLPEEVGAVVSRSALVTVLGDPELTEGTPC